MKKKASNLWFKVEALGAYLKEMDTHEKRFVKNLLAHLNPYSPLEELTESQEKWIKTLYEKYC